MLQAITAPKVLNPGLTTIYSGTQAAANNILPNKGFYNSQMTFSEPKLLETNDNSGYKIYQNEFLSEIYGNSIGYSKFIPSEHPAYKGSEKEFLTLKTDPNISNKHSLIHEVINNDDHTGEVFSVEFIMSGHKMQIKQATLCHTTPIKNADVTKKEDKWKIGKTNFEYQDLAPNELETKILKTFLAFDTLYKQGGNTEPPAYISMKSVAEAKPPKQPSASELTAAKQIQQERLAKMI